MEDKPKFGVKNMCMNTQKVIPKRQCYICQKIIPLENERGLCDACVIEEDYNDSINLEERSWQKRD
jgi:hypothetical protein